MTIPGGLSWSLGSEDMMEAWWYEASPFVYALGGLGFVWSTDSILALTSGLLLVTAAIRILLLRRRFRRAAAEHRRKYARRP